MSVPEAKQQEPPAPEVDGGPFSLAWLARWGARIGLVLVIAGLLSYLPLQLFGEKGINHYRRLSVELGELRRRNDRLARQIRRMQLEIRRLRSDDAALEKAAREDLGMIRRGELVFVVED